MLPTEQQQAIYDYVANRRKNIAVNALAGSGKTTTAVQAAKHISGRKSVGFTAFNKHIATELQERLGTSAQAGTIHSLGKRILTNSGINHQIDAQKYGKIHKASFPNSYDHRGKLHDDFSGILRLIDIFRSGLVDHQAEPVSRDRHLRNLADLQGWEFPRTRSMFDEMSAQAAFCVRSGLEQMATIDFSDMISAPNYLGLAKPAYDFLIADEAQDFNRAQQQLVCKIGERIMFVGDPHQSIMLFAGADAASFRTLRKELNATELPLSICWRCPSSHLDLARFLVPGIQDRPGAPEGDYEETVEGAMHRMVKPGELVICRANAPLLSLAYNLVSNSVPVMIRGRNIGQGLYDLITKKLKAGSIQELATKIKLYRDSNFQRLIEREASEAAIQAHIDSCDCIEILCDSHDNLFSLLESIDRLFSESDSEKKVILSSIHRAKGSENDTVYILHPHLLGRRGKNQEATVQEVNLAYVALTRSTNRLVLVDGRKSNRPGTREWLEGMSQMGQKAEAR